MDLSDLIGNRVAASDEIRKEAHGTSSEMPGRTALAGWSTDDIQWGSGAIDTLLEGRVMEGATSHSMQNLTDKGREAAALKLPVEAGTRVTFVANLGSVMAYSDIPGDGVGGTVITVKTVNGNSTSWDGRVMVSWDDGKFRPVSALHLRSANVVRKQAKMVRMVVSNLGDISSLFGPTKVGGGDELVHKATKDLWSFKQDGEGYVIERLFNEDGNPLKD